MTLNDRFLHFFARVRKRLDGIRVMVSHPTVLDLLVDMSNSSQRHMGESDTSLAKIGCCTVRF